MAILPDSVPDRPWLGAPLEREGKRVGVSCNSLARRPAIIARLFLRLVTRRVTGEREGLAAELTGR